MSKLPKTMQAFVLTGHGGLETLEFHNDWPLPQISETEVLIRVRACGLNNTDVNTRLGWYSKSIEGGTEDKGISGNASDAGWGGTPLQFPRIQGADVVGHVVSVGAKVPHGLMDKRVLVDTWLRDWDDPHNKNGVGYYGSECDGGFAEYTKADYRAVHPVKSALSDAELATFATSWMTAEGMLNRAEVGREDVVLVTGASGGVGSALIALANRRGARTLAMTSKAKQAQVRALNPAAIILREDDLTSGLKNEKVTVVADVVAGAIFPDLIHALERGGRYVTSGAIAGAITTLDVRTLYLHDLTLLGSTVVRLGTFDDLIGYINNDEIAPALAASYPLSELKTAQQAFIDKKHVGNIVVVMD